MDEILARYLFCGRKRIYPTKAAAQQAADSAKKEKKYDIVPYQCKFCKAWHNGHPWKKKT
jgi:hypothetical protein